MPGRGFFTPARTPGRGVNPFTRPSVPTNPTRAPWLSPDTKAKIKDFYKTVVAPTVEEAAHDKMVDDMKNLMFGEKKDGGGAVHFTPTPSTAVHPDPSRVDASGGGHPIPGPPPRENVPVVNPKVEHVEEHEVHHDGAGAPSILAGLDKEHLPWSKEVHLVETVGGVRRTYVAVLTILKEIESSEVVDQEDVILEPYHHFGSDAAVSHT